MKIIIKYFSSFFLLLSLFLLIYTFYRSEIIHNGEKHDYYQFYYIISLILISFSVINFFLSKNLKEYFMIILASVFITLYLFEAYLIFKKQLTLNYIYKSQTGKKFDNRTIYQFYKDTKKINKSIVLRAFPSLRLTLENKNKIFPLSGISNSKTILCNSIGYYAIYDSDRYGFNNPDDQWDKEKIEYLIVGDSYAMGECVNRPNDISSVLRNLSNKPVLNLAYGGMGPLMEYATLREYLAQNIKNVLWIYYEGNDFKDLGNELKSELLKNYLLDESYKQNLKSKQSDINLLGKELILVEEEAYLKNMTRKDKILNFIKLVKLRLYFERRNNVSTQSKPQPEFKKILRLVKDLTEKNNSNLFFVYLPEWNRYQKNYSDQNYNYIKKLVNSLNIPFIDIHSEVFLKEKNPLELFPFKLDGHHYTVKSYKKIGSAIFKFVNNQK